MATQMVLIKIKTKREEGGNRTHKEEGVGNYSREETGEGGNEK